MQSRLSRIYQNMKYRCYNPNYPQYKDYGGRGITICDEWNNRELSGNRNHTKGWVAFEKWSLSHGYQDGLSIDRIDNDKGYSPDNCRWTTRKIQCNNRRSNSRISYKGMNKTLAEWSDYLGIDNSILRQRLYRSKTVEEAFTIYVRPRYKIVEYKGRKQSLKEWCKELGLNYETTIARINKRHWTIERAFEEDVHVECRKLH